MTKLATVYGSERVTDAAKATSDFELSADVCVIGSGAGGAVAAAILAQAGIDVLLVEEGGLHTAAEFDQHERDVVPKLYQESMQRTTADGAIAVLQGRTVGGTTVVNWTTSFRTPEDVVEHWGKRHAVSGFRHADLVSHWEAMESRLAVHKVPESEMNRNNQLLFDGCKKLGWHVDTLRRNVFRCMQTGSCGLGCPVNAKRSMLVTMIPDALDAGARLVHRCRVDRLDVAGGEIVSARCTAFAEDGYTKTGRTGLVRAKRFVLSGGAINSPALLLRSGIDDGGRVGERTFLHPVVASLGVFDEPVRAFYGAPQSAASHHFAHRDGAVGLFLETAPSHPMLGASAVPGFGREHRASIEALDRSAVHLAIAIDGFQDDVPGGRVTVLPSGAPRLDYPIPAPLWEAFKFGQKRLAELQLAAGAKKVLTLHDPPFVMTDASVVDRIDWQRWEPCAVPVFTAHQMGGCRMGDDPKSSVVRSTDLRHHALRNLWVMDGSVFPTSLGVNPQFSIYGLAHLMASRFVQAMPRG